MSTAWIYSSIAWKDCRELRSCSEKLNKTFFKSTKASEEINANYERNMQWLQAATLTVTIGTVVVVDALINVVEVKEEDVYLNVNRKLLAHPLTPLNNYPL